jgi:hypothetical protein
MVLRCMELNKALQMGEKSPVNWSVCIKDNNKMFMVLIFY